MYQFFLWKTFRVSCGRNGFRIHWIPLSCLPSKTEEPPFPKHEEVVSLRRKGHMLEAGTTCTSHEIAGTKALHRWIACAFRSRLRVTLPRHRVILPKGRHIDGKSRSQVCVFPANQFSSKSVRAGSARSWNSDLFASPFEIRPMG